VVYWYIADDIVQQRSKGDLYGFCDFQYLINSFKNTEVHKFLGMYVYTYMHAGQF